MKIVSTILFIIISFTIQSQVDVLVSDDDYTAPAQGLCDCGSSFSYVDSLNFHDTGDDVADYLPNEDEVITFCPDVNGNKVATTFGIGGTGFTFDVDPSDTIFIYDGLSIFDPILDTFNNNMMPVGSVPASLSNLSGCLTIRFISDGANEGTGWDANVSCGNFIQPFSVGIEGFINGTANGANDNINDVMPVDTGYIDVCLGDSILLSVDTYFPYEPGGDSAATFGGGYDQTNNHTIEWIISNGVTSNQNTLWIVPPAQQGYFVSLKVTDSFGMNMYATCKIRVSTTPSFVTCIAEDTLLCVNQQTLLIGGVTASDTAGVDATSATFPIGGEFGTATFLPDGNGALYQTEIDIAGYTPGGTIINGTDIQQVCISIEHTYLGDLEMWLTCPNGTEVAIFNSYTSGYLPGGFGGGGTYLGGGNDNASSVGNCEEYCFSEANGALPSWNLGYNTITASGPTVGQMVVPGEYNPEGTFADFVGCPINGTWTLNVQDNILADDGWICQWGIYFLDSLNPNSETYAPEIFDEFWYSDPTIIVDGNNDTTIVIRPDTVGPFGYTFEVLDSYGCSYDTTIFVTVIEPASIMPNTSACLGDEVNFTNTYAPMGGEWWADGPGDVIWVTSQTAINPTISVIQGGAYTFYFTDVQCGDTSSMQVFYSGTPDVGVFYEGDSTVNVVTICTDDQITLTVQGQDADNYIWNIAGGNADSILVSSSVPSTIYYEMVATGFCGDASDGITVITEDCEIPNVITPNSSPGENDVFLTNYANHHNDVNLTIYNRWGRVIYKTDSYDNTWNGVNMNGKKVAAGTYFYVMIWDEGEKDAAGTITVFD